MQISLPNEMLELIASQLAVALKPQIIQAVRQELISDKLQDKTTLSRELGVSYNSLNEMTMMDGFPQPIKGKYSRKAVDKWLEEISKGG